MSGQNIRFPFKPFLYTESQVADLLSIQLGTLKNRYAHYAGRTETRRELDEIYFINIAPEDQAPEWRCAEGELVRWFKRKGFKVYDRTWL